MDYGNYLTKNSEYRSFLFYNINSTFILKRERKEREG